MERDLINAELDMAVAYVAGDNEVPVLARLIKDLEKLVQLYAHHGTAD